MAPRPRRGNQHYHQDCDRPFTGNLSARYAGTDGQKYTVSAGARKNRLTSYTSLTWRQRDTYCIEDGGESSETGGVRSSTVYGYNIWNVSQKLGYTCNEHLSDRPERQFLSQPA